MKQVSFGLKNWMTILFFAFATMTFANNAPTLSTKVKTDKKFVLRLVNLQGEKTKISIQNISNKVVYKETLRSTEDYVKTFDLKFLPKGTYKIKVKWDGGEITQPIAYESETLAIAKTEQSVIKAPTFEVGQNAVVVGLVKSINQNAKTRILNKVGKVVFRDTFKKVGRQKRNYNLDQLESGEYTIQVNIDDKFYYQNVKVSK